MEGSIKDLADIRFEKACEMLKSAQSNLEQGDYKTALNRSYYAIFHAMRSVNCLDGFDSSKHSGVIAHFNQFVLKTGKMDSKYSEYIKKASYCREKSDYDDFYIADKTECSEQVKTARDVFEKALKFLNK